MDELAFEAVFREHRSRVVGIATGVLRDAAAAEEVAQEVFLALWRHPRRFDARRGSLSTYLGMLARSRAVDRYRAETTRRDALRREAAEQAVRGAAVDHLDRHEDAGAVHAALRTLPAPQRQAVTAAAIGFTAAEIAKLAGVPVGTAKSRTRLGLARARVALTPAAGA